MNGSIWAFTTILLLTFPTGCFSSARQTLMNNFSTFPMHVWSRYSIGPQLPCSMLRAIALCACCFILSTSATAVSAF
ncbi:hypothetical protein V1508DRAFT_407427 [Lipomyces doorenjongii]|uniref:uncharacterized protein n=1 Tax=Lipomyces doorenjongii TaxID=383834 RepID=UPI0034CF2EC6